MNPSLVDERDFDSDVIMPGVPKAPLPRVQLFSKPTPLERLPRFSNAVGSVASDAGHDPAVDVWIKREDLMSVGLGGNKLRNLEFHLGAARARGADTIVASGRGRANHCRLAAAAAARSGLRCVLVLSGPRPAEPSPGERMCELFGAELRYSSDASVACRNTLLASVLAEIREGKGVPYVVELGASGAVGASGQVLAAFELLDQLDARALSPDYVFVGAATGGTYVGLQTGFSMAHARAVVIGVPTYFSSAPSESAFRDHLTLLTSELRELWGATQAVEADPGPQMIVLDDLTTWLPYWTASPEATVAAELLARTEGVAADPVYTARSVAAILAWARAGRLERKTVVLWHGGGTPALFEDYGA